MRAYLISLTSHNFCNCTPTLTTWNNNLNETISNPPNGRKHMGSWGFSITSQLTSPHQTTSLRTYCACLTSLVNTIPRVCLITLTSHNFCICTPTLTTWNNNLHDSQLLTKMRQFPIHPMAESIWEVGDCPLQARLPHLTNPHPYTHIVHVEVH